MSLQWDGKYKFEPGDIVEVVGDNHPYKGMRGIIKTTFSSQQFGVVFLDRELSLWADNLLLIETHRDSDVPETFKKAFE